MFSGEYQRTLDETGKVPIPKRFRAQFKVGKIAIIPSRDYCLCIYPWEKYEKPEEEFEKLVKRAGERRLVRSIFPQEAIQELDEEGRIFIPVGLRRRANIEPGEVVFIGCNEHFEIWSKERRAEAKREEVSWRDPLEDLRLLEQRRESIEKELEDLGCELEGMIEEPTREHLMAKHQEAIVIIRKIEGLISEFKKFKRNIVSKL